MTKIQRVLKWSWLVTTVYTIIMSTPRIIFFLNFKFQTIIFDYEYNRRGFKVNVYIIRGLNVDIRYYSRIKTNTCSEVFRNTFVQLYGKFFPRKNR